MSHAPVPIEIAVLAYPQTSASVVFGMYDLFLSAGRDWGAIVEGRPGPSLMRPRIASKHGEAFTVGNGVPIKPEVTLEQFPRPAIVCVPEILFSPGEPLDRRFDAEIAWLQKCYASGAVLATACSGAVLLAEAGLLRGLDATTHWAYCDEMQRRYPDIRVHRQRSLVITGEGQRLVMAGAGTSWLDLALYLIARHVGVEVAMQTARLNLIDWHAVGQQPFARLADSRQSEDATIAHCQHWIAEHHRERTPVATMASLSGLPERSFKRRFRQATGMSPIEYVHTLRIEEAKHMLEAGNAPVEAVANDVGYEDAGFFSRLFRRHVGLSPNEYRKRFGSMRRALQGIGAQGSSGGKPREAARAAPSEATPSPAKAQLATDQED
jgi:transcriptional regulator GlxA family with amidase domain